MKTKLEVFVKHLTAQNQSSEFKYQDWNLKHENYVEVTSGPMTLTDSSYHASVHPFPYLKKMTQEKGEY